MSRPTWVGEKFKGGLKTFLLLLSNLGLKPRTIGASDVPSKVPLDEVIEVMRECSGAVVLGYPQVVVSSGNLKGKNLKSNLVLPTEWNHIEASLAYASRLPLLVIHHLGITRGIFERGVMNAFLHGIDLTNVNWPMESTINGAISKWVSNCRKGGINPTGQKNVGEMSKKPVCPNCTSSQRPFYMSPIPPEFVELIGGKWECTKCKFLT